MLKEDGIDFINVFSMGSTELGKFLSNMYPEPMEIDGVTFKTLEHYWQWLKATYFHEHELAKKILDVDIGFEAKRLAYEIKGSKSLMKSYVSSNRFRSLICRAVRQKIMGNSWAVDELRFSTAPFRHILVSANGSTYDHSLKYSWLLVCIENLRKELQKEYLDDLMERYGAEVVKKHNSDIYIGRGSPFGNNYSHLENTKAEFVVETREEAIIKYRQDLVKGILNGTVDPLSIARLHKKKLGCYCNNGNTSIKGGGHYCHGLILKSLAEMFYVEERDG